MIDWKKYLSYEVKLKKSGSVTPSGYFFEVGNLEVLKK